MKLAYFIKKSRSDTDPRISALLTKLGAGGHEAYAVGGPGEIIPGTDVLLSLGGDGTFLDAARIAVAAGVPVAGVNFGRMGFLSEFEPDEILDALSSRNFVSESRALLEVKASSGDSTLPYALNEISVSRAGAAMLGIDVEVNGALLPTYWADGMLLATSSGSTAYALSVGGPICTPDSKVFILAPVSPHNLNVRPLVIPESSRVRMSFRSRESSVKFTIDNSNYVIPADTVLEIGKAPSCLFSLSPVRSNFINALRGRLHWGEDVRNSSDRF